MRAFDTVGSGSVQATGFVVDRQLGIIMTNRHVVTTGPVTADAVLLNKEEVELTPLYADPVHDFGFFRYDPAAVKFMQLFEVPLAPSEARVGVEVQALGAEAGVGDAPERGAGVGLAPVAPVAPVAVVASVAPLATVAPHDSANPTLWGLTPEFLRI